MNIYHHPIARLIRSAARKSGILRIMKTTLGQRGGYEDAFSAGLKAAIKRGDVVWDVGANVGHYTTQFKNLTGDGGKVVAFEPLPAARQKLNANLLASGLDDGIVVCETALSDWEGEAVFEGDSGDGNVVTTAHLSDRESNSGESKKHRVKVMTADKAWAAMDLPLPTVTKIDVEGYEEEVLNGGVKVFSSPQSRHIFIEVHFERLDERGKGEAPARIAKLLKSWGYKVRWLDASHLHSFREK